MVIFIWLLCQKFLQLVLDLFDSGPVCDLAHRGQVFACQPRIVGWVAKAPESHHGIRIRVILNGLNPGSFYRLDVFPNDLFVCGYLKEMSGWARTDQGVSVRQSLGAGNKGTTEAIIIFGSEIPCNLV